MAGPEFGSSIQQSWWGVLVAEFAPAVLREWKAWLTGSTPMASLYVTGLVRPDWVAFPLWIWASLLFGAGLLMATFSVYHEVRKERDELRSLHASLPINGPFLLLRWSGALTDLESKLSEKELP